MGRVPRYIGCIAHLQMVFALPRCLWQGRAGHQHQQQQQHHAQRMSGRVGPGGAPAAAHAPGRVGGCAAGAGWLTAAARGAAAAGPMLLLLLLLLLSGCRGVVVDGFAGVFCVWWVGGLAGGWAPCLGLKPRWRPLPICWLSCGCSGCTEVETVASALTTCL